MKSSSNSSLLLSSLSLRQLILVAFMAGLIAIGAFIRIPVPVVPFTLQFLFTMLAGTLLGGRLGALSVGLYLCLGLIGLPIFAEGGGIWYIMKPSFGYLIGFAAASYVTGKLIEQRPRASLLQILAANLIGLVIVYLIGLGYYYGLMNFVLMSPIAIWPLFVYGFVLAVPGDLVLCMVAALITLRLRPRLRYYL